MILPYTVRLYILHKNTSQLFCVLFNLCNNFVKFTNNFQVKIVWKYILYFFCCFFSVLAYEFIVSFCSDFLPAVPKVII